MNEQTRENLTTDILDQLYCTYTVDGETVQGQSVSFVKANLGCKSGRRWKNLGNLNDFEDLCREIGFRVVEGRNLRNQKARVVTV